MGGARLIANSGLLVPVLFVVLALLWWRGRHAGRARADLLLRSAFSAWVVALIALALFPLPLPPYEAVGPLPPDVRGWPAPWASIVPFATIRGSFGEMWGYGAGRYLVGNIAGFVPLGLLAPMLSARGRYWPLALLIGFVASALIELAQLGLSLVMGFPWRVADVDDLLLNVVGTLVGYFAWSIGRAMIGRHRAPAAA